MMTGKAKYAVRRITAVALCAAILLALQVAMAGLPNIEMVSLLIIIYTLTLRRDALFVIYVFALVQGLIYGFSMWWVTYLYIWTVLAAVAWMFRSMRSPVGWAVVSGTFGLMFGALDAIPYLFIGGWSMAAARWVSGIPFDLIHCAGNFVVAIILFKPLYKLFDKNKNL